MAAEMSNYYKTKDARVTGVTVEGSQMTVSFTDPDADANLTMQLTVNLVKDEVVNTYADGVQIIFLTDLFSFRRELVRAATAARLSRQART